MSVPDRVRRRFSANDTDRFPLVPPQLTSSGMQEREHDQPVLDRLGWRNRWQRRRLEKRAKTLLDEACPKYFEQLRQLSIVSGLLVGKREGRTGLYIAHIYDHDVTPEEMQANYGPYHQLSEISAAFQITVRDVLPSQLFEVNPSDVESLETRWQTQRIHSQRIQLR